MSSWDRSFFKAIALLSLLTSASVVAATDEPVCGVARPPASDGSDTFYQRGRAVTRVYVPENTLGSNDPDILNNIACLMGKANTAWQTACPANDIPEIQVIRGQRPPAALTDIAVEVTEGFAPAVWAEDNNTIYFAPHNGFNTFQCEPDGSTSLTDIRHYINTTVHELGHAFGLDHDGVTCKSSPGGAGQFRSIMNDSLSPGAYPPYLIRPGHCEAIEEINSCNDNDKSCCLYCLPPIRDKCEIAPELCGVEPSPSGGGFCNYSLTYEYGGGVTYEYPGGAIVNSTIQLVSSSLYCYSNSQNPPVSAQTNGRSIQANAITPGPTVYVRSRFPQGAAGLADIRGVARDDIWGIQRLEFWLDNEPITLQNLQLRQYDPHTCSEMNTGDCDPYSAFHGLLDTTNLAPGPHKLQILALSDHPERIPVYHEWDFEVASPCESNPPAVNIAQPLTSQTVADEVLIVATASDDTAVERVKFYVDGSLIRNDTTYPYTVRWDTRSVADGWRDITAEAHDVCGNRKTSLVARVRVDNGMYVVQVNPIADAWVSQTWPTTNYGSTDYLRIRTIDGGIARHTYLKFQVTGVQGAVISAKLRLRTQNRTLVEPVTVYRIADTYWQEDTINYTNASLAVLWSAPVPVPMMAESWYEIDVTGAITGDGVYTLALATVEDIGNLDFWSRESAYPPELVVEFWP